MKRKIITGTLLAALSLNATAGDWETLAWEDEITGEKSMVSYIDSARTTTTSLGKVTPRLMVRCIKENSSDDKNSLRAIINWRTFIDVDSTTADVRFDENPAQTMTVSVSSSHKVISLPKDTEIFQALRDGRKLAIRVTPYGENTLTAVFPLEGAAKALQPVFELCGFNGE